jgi:RNA polymerase sigma-70 factor (ECF subfamily)
MTERKIDGRIIDACRQGDREAFRLLFESYKDRVYSIALFFLDGDEASAEDITQEVFLRLFTRIGQFRNEADFATWLYRLVANACVDEQRRRKRVVFFGDVGEMPGVGEEPSLGEPYRRLEITDAVKAAVADLQPTLRMTILLKYFEELSYEEMAKALGCSQGTVASRLHRSLKILARKLAYLRDTVVSGE